MIAKAITLSLQIQLEVTQLLYMHKCFAIKILFIYSNQFIVTGKSEELWLWGGQRSGAFLRQKSHLRKREFFKRSETKSTSDALTVEIKPLADFIKMVATELFKQGIGDNWSDNSLGDDPGGGNGTGVTAFKA